MKLGKVSTTVEFAEMKQTWESLTEAPLRSFEWNFAWWNQFGENAELSIYTLEVEDRVVGIAPMFIDSWMGQKRLRFLGTGDTCSDYVDLIVSPDYRDAFVERIAEDMRGQISMVEIEGIMEGSSDQQKMASLGHSHWRYDGELDPTWIIDLPASWTEFVSASKKSLKRKIKKAQKRLDSGEIVVQSTQDDLDFDTAFATLVELHQDRFEGKGEPGVFSDDRFTQFLNTAARSLIHDGRAEILVAFHQEQPIAAQFYLLNESGPQLYQAGVRTAAMNLEPGHVMFTFAVQRAIANGSHKFDFLRGNESYKPYWGAKPQPLLKIRWVSNRWIPTLVNRSFRFLRGLKHRAKSWLRPASTTG